MYLLMDEFITKLCTPLPYMMIVGRYLWDLGHVPFTTAGQSVSRASSRLGTVIPKYFFLYL